MLPMFVGESFGRKVSFVYTMFVWVLTHLLDFLNWQELEFHTI